MSKYFVYTFGLLLLATISQCHPGTLDKKSVKESNLTSCGGVINANSGTIDYLFPEGETYPVNSACIWTIRMDPAKTHVELIKPQSYLRTHFDFVTVTGFTNRGSVEQHSTSFGINTNQPEEAVLEGQVFIVVFSSTEQNNHRGFQLHFRAIGAPDTSMRQWVDIHNSEVEGTLTYPSDGAYYHNYEFSTFVISKNYSWNNGPKLTLSVDYHYIENSTGCSLDGLLVFREERGMLRQMARYCGNNNWPIALQSEDNYILVLYSDWSTTGEGFSVHWKLNPE